MRAPIQAPADRRTSSARDSWSWAHGIWRRWRQRIHTRAELRAMDARSLAEIGMDPETARQETRKFFWQG
jgi:uncharacterized protein YjiS (DUF1127 family)